RTAVGVPDSGKRGAGNRQGPKPRADPPEWSGRCPSRLPVALEKIAEEDVAEKLRCVRGPEEKWPRPQPGVRPAQIVEWTWSRLGAFLRPYQGDEAVQSVQH